MRRWLLSLLLACPSAAGAAGINLSWHDCGALGSGNETFACDTNQGSSALVGTFQLDQELFDHKTSDILLDLHVDAATMPAWWTFEYPGSCRTSSLAPPQGEPDSLGCHRGFAGYAAVVEYVPGYGGPNRARIRLHAVNQLTVINTIPANTESQAFKLLLKRDRTVGPDSCAGCGVGVCLVFREIRLNAGLEGDETLTAPLFRQHVTWQGGSSECPGATPVRGVTWGAIKALYR